MDYELKHIGINAENAEESLALAKMFCEIFGWNLKEGNSSNFAGVGVEVMKEPYLGKNGHLALAVDSVEEAMEELQAKGVQFRLDTAKEKEGHINAVYLQEEFAGFAVHLLRKA